MQFGFMSGCKTLIDCMIFLSSLLDFIKMSLSTDVFFPRTVRLWIFLPAEYCPFTLYLNDFKCKVIRHLSSLGFSNQLFYMFLICYFSCNTML